MTECDLVAKTVEGDATSYLRQADGSFLPDDGTPAIAEATLRSSADPDGAAQDIVYTCVPPGSGQRMGIDRDEDGIANGLDNCPAWPNGPAGGTCLAGNAALLASRCSLASDCGTGGVCSTAQEDADGDGTGDACELAVIAVPEPGLGIGLVAGAVSLLLIHGCRRRIAIRR